VKIDEDLLAILACPACHAALRVDQAAEELICTGCGRAYPVRDDIPVLLVDEARLPERADDAGDAGDRPGEKPADGG
jgi:uncharacterized protein YbaR (Trm112 family)